MNTALPMMSRDTEQNSVSMFIIALFEEASDNFARRGRLQLAKVLIISLYHALWNPGTIARLLTFHVSGSAGMSPFPIIGSNISAKRPLSYAFALSLKICFAIVGSDITMKDFGPNSSLYTLPNCCVE